MSVTSQLHKPALFDRARRNVLGDSGDSWSSGSRTSPVTLTRSLLSGTSSLTRNRLERTGDTVLNTSLRLAEGDVPTASLISVPESDEADAKRVQSGFSITDLQSVPRHVEIQHKLSQMENGYCLHSLPPPFRFHQRTFVDAGSLRRLP